MLKRIFQKTREHLYISKTEMREIGYRLKQIAAIEVARELDRLANSSTRARDELRLTRFERKVFSQSGEDGILLEIFRRIGTTNRFFIEFGVEHGLENNTAYLAITGWRGLWIEADPRSYEKAKQNFGGEIASGQLTLLCEAVTPDNVEALFRKGMAESEPDLLSIDIDGNDLHVLSAMKDFRPRVLVCEYNAIYPPPQKWSVAKNSSYASNMTSHFGASLSSFCEVAGNLGYCLVGCSLSGCNAFFVRKDLATPERFCAPFTAENHYEPPRYYLVKDWVGHDRVMGPRATL